MARWRPGACSPPVRRLSVSVRRIDTGGQGAWTLYGDGLRNRGLRLRQTRLILEVHPLLLHHQRAFLDVRMDGTDVLAEYAHGNQLHRTQEEDADDQGRHAHRKPVP